MNDSKGLCSVCMSAHCYADLTGADGISSQYHWAVREGVERMGMITVGEASFDEDSPDCDCCGQSDGLFHRWAWEPPYQPDTSEPETPQRRGYSELGALAVLVWALIIVTIPLVALGSIRTVTDCASAARELPADVQSVVYSLCLESNK